MKIAIGTDHAGYELKESLKTFLKEGGYEIVDCGAYEYNEDDDYPDFVIPVASAVSRGEAGRGIVIGGSGQGEAMVANRFLNVRAAVFYGGEENIITLSREHNDANVLSLGAKFLSVQDAEKAVELWLKTAFSSDERHIRRIEKINRVSQS
ncbi:MAG: RpiB/LacA/LacB family sugar-phosphate isomerase [Candidatus Pacebacteria bacterium]|nr:RpiB/LacA/LacB family sugar-phosphate isomerase [Candidatus Paceibacterota bacterium]